VNVGHSGTQSRKLRRRGSAFPAEGTASFIEKKYIAKKGRGGPIGVQWEESEWKKRAKWGSPKASSSLEGQFPGSGTGGRGGGGAGGHSAVP